MLGSIAFFTSPFDSPPPASAPCSFQVQGQYLPKLSQNTKTTRGMGDDAVISHIHFQCISYLCPRLSSSLAVALLSFIASSSSQLFLVVSSA